MRMRASSALAVVVLVGMVGCRGPARQGPPIPPGCEADEQCAAATFCSAAGACTPFANPGTDCHRQADCAVGQACAAGACVTPVAECDRAENAARRDALLAAQPALRVGTSAGHKAVRTGALTWASLAGDPSVRCAVDVAYKDLSGDGQLQPYEDWSRPAAERAADLVGRMARAEKLALLAHASLPDVPAGTSPASAGTLAVLDAGIRFGQTSAGSASPTARATWANGLQERSEAAPWGIPFVLSSEPVHASGSGRAKARGFSQWPGELGLGATGDLALVERFGRIVAKEYRAVGITMALSPSADLATEPRWPGSQSTFGEDSAQVAAMAGAYVKGLQGSVGSRTGVAAVVGHFPGAGPARGGWDARLEKGKRLAYPGHRFDDHVGAFQGALDQGVAGVMTGHGVPEAGPWTGLGGLVDGATIEQVASSFSPTIVTTVLRQHLAFGGLVIAPAGVLLDAGLAPLGAPWGLEAATPGQRVRRAVAAGVDQFLGVNDLTGLSAADLPDAQVDAAAGRALVVALRLGLFEDPYVEPALAPYACNDDTASAAGLEAMRRSMVLLLNRPKPAGWLNGSGDGTQVGDPYNAGNGTGRILPAPHGTPYPLPTCDFFVAGDFDVASVRAVSAGYGTLVNDEAFVKGVAISPDPALARQQRLALSDYVFIRVAAPATADPESGPLGLPRAPLDYAGNDPAVLAPVAEARAAIDAWTGTPPSQAQIVVIVDAGRPSVVSELLEGSLGISGLYLSWAGAAPANVHGDRVALDVMFGVFEGSGRLPVGLPASDATAGGQREDVAGDGQDPVLVRGFGLQTTAF